MKLTTSKHYIEELLDEALKLEGDIIELGAGTGKTIIEVAQFMQKKGIDKPIFACDTWTGFPYDEENEDIPNPLKKGEFNHFTKEKFTKLCQMMKVADLITEVQGMFEETLEKELADKKFCYAYLDADMYKSTKIGFKFLEDRMVAGGIIAIHDYGNKRCPGIKKMVDEEIDTAKFEIIAITGMTAFLKKKTGEQKKEQPKKPKLNPEEKTQEEAQEPTKEEKEAEKALKEHKQKECDKESAEVQQEEERETQEKQEKPAEKEQGEQKKEEGKDEEEKKE